MRVEIQKLDKDLPTPKYANPGDVGFDLYSSEQDYILRPMEKKIFKTGLKIAIPEGYVGSIRDRSGLAAKHALHTLAGVIDPGYRGEIGIVMINLGKEEIKIERATRIAQMLIQPVAIVQLEEKEELSETHRGEGGFGSTGKK